MYTKEEIELLKNQLLACYGNYIEIIIKETGISRPTVSKFFNHRPINPKNQILIYRTGCELVQQRRQEDKDLVKNLKKMAKDHSTNGQQSSLNLWK